MQLMTSVQNRGGQGDRGPFKRSVMMKVQNVGESMFKRGWIALALVSVLALAVATNQPVVPRYAPLCPW